MDYEISVNTFGRNGTGLTRELVVDAVYALAGWVTRRQVADYLQMSKSPRLNAFLESAVSAGLLVRGRSYKSNGMLVYYYHRPEVE